MESCRVRDDTSGKHKAHAYLPYTTGSTCNASPNRSGGVLGIALSYSGNSSPEEERINSSV